MVGKVIVKGVLGIMSSIGAGDIVANVCKLVTPENVKGIRKVCYVLGTAALSGVAADKAYDYIDETVDKICEIGSSSKRIVNEVRRGATEAMQPVEEVQDGEL